MRNIKEAIEVYVETAQELKGKPESNFIGIKEVEVNA